MSPLATIVISTKNRKDELRNAIDSCLAQTVPAEILVIDDGSTDGTSEMIRRDYPMVRLHRSEQSEGLIAQRNRGAQMALGEIIFSIDDDCVFTSPMTVEQTLAEFNEPRVAVVSIPFVNVKYEKQVRMRAPDDGRTWVSPAFQGGAHAIRRDLFQRIGGYRAFLFRQGEESDLTIRLMDKGYVAAMGRGDVIHHLESPRRNRGLIVRYMARNLVLYAWWNVPSLMLPIHLAATSTNTILFALRRGGLLSAIGGLCIGYIDALRQVRQRRAVSLRTYRLMHRLKRAVRIPLDEILPDLPPMSLT